MVITLIGYRGCGKTSVARLLAEHLGWEWVDADVALEAEAGKSIKEIFETEGEASFRQRERRLIQAFLQKKNLVLASGGGAILNSETRQKMKQAGPVIWLNATVDTLTARIEADALSRSQRPSLTGQSSTAEVAQVLKEREPLYREAATLIIETDILSPEEIAREIESQLEVILKPSDGSN
ncbi:MAG: shikimate kinase [Planctomycetaceae bacterium]|nr:shikimate kinase [Planctomycetaceae bacterium]